MVFSTGWNIFSTSIDFTFFILISKTNCFPLKINYFHHYFSAIKSAKLKHSTWIFIEKEINLENGGNYLWKGKSFVKMVFGKGMGDILLQMRDNKFESGAKLTF